MYVTIYGAGEAACVHWDVEAAKAAEQFWRVIEHVPRGAPVCSMGRSSAIIEVRQGSLIDQGNGICARLTAKGWREIEGPGERAEREQAAAEAKQEAERRAQAAVEQEHQEAAEAVKHAHERTQQQAEDAARQHQEAGERAKEAHERQQESEHQHHEEQVQREEQAREARHNEEETRHSEAEANRAE